MSGAEYLIDTSALIRRMFSWVVMPDGVFEQASQLQTALSEKGRTDPRGRSTF